jgi:hypothetical protein
MKVRERVSGEIFSVYGIYWHEDKTYFYCFPKKSTGLSSYSEDEVDIVEPALGHEFQYAVLNVHGIFHKHLIGEQLLDALLEHDPVAYKKFVSLIKGEP